MITILKLLKGILSGVCLPLWLVKVILLENDVAAISYDEEEEEEETIEDSSERIAS